MDDSPGGIRSRTHERVTLERRPNHALALVARTLMAFEVRTPPASPAFVPRTRHSQLPTNPLWFRLTLWSTL